MPGGLGGPRAAQDRPPSTHTAQPSAPDLQPIIRIAMASHQRPAFGWWDSPPSRRISVCLLVAALAFLVLPSYGTPQAPRRPATPLQTPSRAFVEARSDEADATPDRLDPTD